MYIGEIIKKVKGPGLAGQLMRGITGSAAVRVISALLSLATTTILARVLGAEGFGIYSFAFSIAMLLAVPTQAGLPVLVLRETARYQAQSQWALIRGIFRFANRFAVLGSLVAVSIGMLVVWVIGRPSDEIILYAFSFLLIPLIAIGNVRGAVLQGFRHVVLGQLPENIIRPAVWLLIIVAYILARKDVTPTNAMAAHALGSLAAVWIGAAILRTKLNPEVKRSISTSNTRVWLRSLLPLSIMVGVQVVNLQIGTIALGFLHDKQEVGIYRAAVQVGLVVGFALSIIGAASAPHIARVHVSGSHKSLQTLVRSATFLTTIIALPAVTACIFFGRNILFVLYGAEFLEGYSTLVLLCVAHFICAAIGPIVLLMNMTKNENETLRGSLASAACNITICLLLVPAMGMLGAAIATGMSMIVQNLYLARRAKVVLNIRCGPI